MTDTENFYCDAPTMPEMENTLPDPNVSSALPGNFELRGYKFLKVLGRSHCFISYLAEDQADQSDQQRYVVIKEYYPSLSARRLITGELEPIAANKRISFETGKKRFLKEASFLMAIDHPSIVHVDTVFSANGSVYMVMPYEIGETLFDIMRRKGRINQQGLLDLFFSLSEALSLLHEQDCIHRDLKPSNIFVRQSGQPVILDFGAAIFMNDKDETCIPMISQGYTPIEQYSTNTIDQGFWTDFYALAALLYKGVTGVAPVDAVERGQKILKDLEDPYIPLVSVASDQYTLRFLSAIDHGLCFRAQDRPQNIADWCAEFDGTAPVWLSAKEVRKDLLAQSAKRAIDFDLKS